MQGKPWSPEDTVLTKGSAVLMNCNSDKLQDPSKTEKNTKLTREVN